MIINLNFYNFLVKFLHLQGKTLYTNIMLNATTNIYAFKQLYSLYP